MGLIWADRAIDFGRSWVRTRSIAKLLELLRDLRPTPPMFRNQWYSITAVIGVRIELAYEGG